MKVRDLLDQEIDIDVYDSACDDIGIAFCGPMKMTEEGEKKFAEVLDYEIKLSRGYGMSVCVVEVDKDNAPDKVVMKRIKKAKEFFWSIAGYCACDDFDKWFVFDDEEE